MSLVFLIIIKASGMSATVSSMSSTLKFLFLVSAVSGSYFSLISSAAFLSAQLLQLQSNAKNMEKIVKTRKSCHQKQNINRIYNEQMQAISLQQSLTLKVVFATYTDVQLVLHTYYTN